ncbi:hypothetical protein [Membranihabitans marinus]|uniref:hypothetical protein n=1 Tax=Membranihabitans marinus TaxID=1227546 RepID=UPI001F2C04FA|nr:hypothetical protein [Membranihabitans marinus]
MKEKLNLFNRMHIEDIFANAVSVKDRNYYFPDGIFIYLKNNDNNESIYFIDGIKSTIHIELVNSYNEKIDLTYFMNSTYPHKLTVSSHKNNPIDSIEIFMADVESKIQFENYALLFKSKHGNLVLVYLAFPKKGLNLIVDENTINDFFVNHPIGKKCKIVDL